MTQLENGVVVGSFGKGSMRLQSRSR